MDHKQEADEIARILLAEHFDKVNSNVQTTGNVLIDKSIEILTGRGFSVTSVTLNNRLVTLFKNGSDPISIRHYDDEEPCLRNEGRNSYEFAPTFIDRMLGLGIRENLVSLEINK